jgi:hypothetical protein
MIGEARTRLTTMDSAYSSAFAALTGSARAQLKAQQHGHKPSKREDLYEDFISACREELRYESWSNDESPDVPPV